MTRTHVGHSPKRHLVPYLYTGQYETNLTGLIHMDARWYSPQQGRWLQPDYYSFSQLALPNSARHQLLGSTTLNTQHLLRDPGQQMRYGYVSGNPLRWVDPMGLCGFWSGVGSAISGTASAVGSAIGSAASAVGSTAGSMASAIGSASATAGSIALDVAGKAWASPMTAVGLAHGGAGYIVGNIGYAMGRVEDRPEISLGHNAVQFHNNPLMVHPETAVTLGNVISYGSEESPENFGVYDDPEVNLGLHEEAHTYQYQVLGVFFLPSYLHQGGIDRNNPYEQAAQEYGKGEGHWWPWSSND
ncbi:hypothetical protein E4656_20015 [Natronospirillum operosum]|uniref:RHS repeat-associated core domain-containing protein n=1 Tax=Natronospirillum operosum TaxID=2759953 RepID=A0A4Z0W495_9GAMM|nr:RHS repeat-associated core domain-containing protein [Natronospirillum operosum]TGG89387.1 hypothetical protein E4656_20015 [Natronospirillum operosum]